MLHQILSEVKVIGVTAVWYQCTPSWVLPERKIGDDMFFYVTKGVGVACVNGKKAPLFPGACVFFPRGVSHQASTNPKNPIDVICIHHTTTVFDGVLLSELLEFPASLNCNQDRTIETMFREACREYALRPPGCERGMEALVMRLLFHFIQNYSRMFRLNQIASKVSDFQRLLPALNVIKSSLAAPVSIPALAAKAGYSQAQFRRVFERTLQQSPIEYIRKIRMQHACWLLRHTSQTVESIAMNIGYDEVSYFSRAFKSLIKCSPGRYRDNHPLS